MSDPFHRILELCNALNAFAEDLDRPRGRAPSLYLAVEPFYQELEGYIQAATPDLIGRVFSDLRVLTAESGLHRLRAAYEYDKEVVRARAMLDGRGGPARLARFLDDESYWALGPELRSALSGRRHVLVAGSGPLPLTALCVASELGVQVTVVECDAEAFELSRRVIEHSGYGDTIAGIEADLVDLEHLDTYDAIVGTVLLGVDGRHGRLNCKSEIVDHVLARMRPNASLILRDPHGLGRLLYPPLKLTASNDIEVTRHVPETGPGVPYRSGLVVARRRGLELRDDTQAPYAFIRDYYRNVQRKYERFPGEASFCQLSLQHIRGPCVLNVGCGPLLYDDVLHFGDPPREYVGLDINQNTFEFLRRSRDPRLLRAKARARALGTRIEYLCADIFECEHRLEGRFNSVLGLGFFATFHSTGFDRLMRLLHRTLKDGGMLLKITWHGPHRTPEETRKKLAYRYDSPGEPSPADLVTGIERAGFTLRYQSVLECDPTSYGWEAIQACVFQKT